jgi:hypothetical protein
LGRWISRDPIGERAGLSLYIIVQNKVINQVDFLGLLKVGIYIPNGYDHYHNGHLLVTAEQENNHFKRLALLGADGKNEHLGKCNTGKEILSFLEDQYKKNKCPIKKLTMVGHGWGYIRGRLGGLGIHGEGINRWVEDGFYDDSFAGASSQAAKISDLIQKINAKEIKFEEKKCNIAIYACRVSETFARSLAMATKCNVTAAAGQCSEGEATKCGKDGVAGACWKSGSGSGTELAEKKEDGILIRGFYTVNYSDTGLTVVNEGSYINNQ